VTAPTTNETSSKRPPKAIAATLIVAIPIAIALMLFAFLAPTLASGPNNLPISVSAPAPVTEQLTNSLTQRSPDAFDITTATSREDVEDAILEREAVGGIVVDAEGATAYTADGNGTPYAQVLTPVAGALEATGQQVDTVDLAPTTADDPTAAGIATLALPLAFGGLLSGAAITFLLKRRPTMQLATSLSVSILGGFVAAAILHFGYGTLAGNFWLEATAIATGIAALSLFTVGAGSLLGAAGIGLTAALTIFIANPLSGLATGPWWLPAGWATFGQWLPIGATGNLVRSIAFFDGAGTHGSWWILLGWILVGLALLATSARKNSGEQATSTAE